MSIDVEYTCPFGSDCEKVEDGKIKRCRFYINLKGTDPQTNEPVDNWYCSIAVTPILLIENTGQQIRTGSAIESLRNETNRGYQMLAQHTNISPALKAEPKDVTGLIEHSGEE